MLGHELWPTVYLRPVQSDPLRRAGLVVTGLLLNGSVGETVSVLQGLLFGRPDLPDAQDRPGPEAAVARLPTFGPVPNEPPGRAQQYKD